MCHKKTVEYIKTSSLGAGSVPIGAKGVVLIFVDNVNVPKLLVDFKQYGKTIVPLSAVNLLG